jgi:hypothetical protein
LYENPEIETNRIVHFKIKFLQEVKSKLRSKSLDPMFTVECDHDIFRYLVRGKGYPSNVPGATMLDKDDLVRFALPSSWFYTLDKFGDGYCVEFPVRAKPVLRRSSKDFVVNNDGILIQSPTYIFEMATFYITKRPCSKDSIQLCAA